MVIVHHPGKGMNRRAGLGQFFAQEWVVEALIRALLPGPGVVPDSVLQPACGGGGFLQALPAAMSSAIGVEIDPALARADLREQ